MVPRVSGLVAQTALVGVRAPPLEVGVMILGESQLL